MELLDLQRVVLTQLEACHVAAMLITVHLAIMAYNDGVDISAAGLSAMQMTEECCKMAPSNGVTEYLVPYLCI